MATKKQKKNKKRSGAWVFISESKLPSTRAPVRSARSGQFVEPSAVPKTVAKKKATRRSSDDTESTGPRVSSAGRHVWPVAKKKK